MSDNPGESGWHAELDQDDLTEDRVPADPMALFATWFEQARAADLFDPTAMTLATADPLGKPSARTVLLKGFDDRGFRFYTNYDSRKGREINANPHAALVFWWDRLERQVRIEGEIAPIPPADSDSYFTSRPRGSRIGAHASPQSRVIADRQTLERAYEQTVERFGDDGPVPRPAHWGGYNLSPRAIEFWQGRRNRLHDRLVYRRSDQRWRLQRLAP